MPPFNKKTKRIKNALRRNRETRNRQKSSDDIIKDKLLDTIDKSIEIELNVSKIYNQLFFIFDNYKEFFWDLSLEEKNHAALLKTIRLYVKNYNIKNKVSNKIEKEIEKIIDMKNDLDKENIKLENTLKNFINNPPDMVTALDVMYDIENSAAELHFQKIFTKDKNTSEIIKIFRELNGKDIDHARRIKEFKNRITNKN